MKMAPVDRQQPSSGVATAAASDLPRRCHPSLELQASGLSVLAGVLHGEANCSSWRDSDWRLAHQVCLQLHAHTIRYDRLGTAISAFLLLFSLPFFLSFFLPVFSCLCLSDFSCFSSFPLLSCPRAGFARDSAAVATRQEKKRKETKILVFRFLFSPTPTTFCRNQGRLALTLFAR